MEIGNTTEYIKFTYSEFKIILEAESLGVIEFGKEEPVIYRPYIIDTVTIKNGAAKIILSYHSSLRRGKKKNTVILKLNQLVTSLNLPYLAMNLSGESLRVEPASNDCSSVNIIGNRYTLQIGQEYIKFC